MKIPQPTHSIPALLYRWWESQADEGLRPHLGASQIGHPCARFLWLTFRWVSKSTFEGRMLRLFNRGQREEAVMIQELKGLGAEVSDCDPDGNQWRVSACGGHFGGSLDGVVKGLPHASQSWEVVEFKTHNAASFKDLSDKGVVVSKPQHYAQMQTYMHLTGMERANYLAVNKNTDELYYERVRYDRDTASALIERAERVIFAPEAPAGISTDTSWYQCKMCSMQPVCQKEQFPLPTCRSCAHSTPTRNGTWECELKQIPLSTESQKQGCSGHRYNPTLLYWAEIIEANSEENWVVYQSPRGAFANGEQPNQKTSQQLYQENL